MSARTGLVLHINGLMFCFFLFLLFLDSYHKSMFTGFNKKIIDCVILFSVYVFWQCLYNTAMLNLKKRPKGKIRLCEAFKKNLCKLKKEVLMDREHTDCRQQQQQQEPKFSKDRMLQTWGTVYNLIHVPLSH